MLSNMHIMRRRSLPLIAASLACTAMSSAQAQVAPETATEPEASTVDRDDSVIVVTAERRTERVLDVPASITAMSSQRLQSAGITRIQEISQVTPGLSFPLTGVATQPTIRGVGTTNASAGDSPNVATYIDDVYQTTQYGGLYELNTIERIEVLKGPQGSLYGRNATGGAIIIHTYDPKPGLTGKASARYGSFNDRAGKLYLSGGTESISANIAAAYAEDDGYIKDIYRHERTGRSMTGAVRGKLLFRPGPGTKILLGADYSKVSDTRSLSYYFFNNTCAACTRNPAFPVANRPNTTALSFEPINRVRKAGVHLEVEQSIGAALVKSVTAYQNVRFRNLTDSDATPANENRTVQSVDDISYTEELTISSNGPGIGWLGGLFLLSQKSNQKDLVVNGVAFFQPIIKAHALGVFGDVTIPFTDRLKLVAGARFSYEKKDIVNVPATGSIFRDSKSWKKVTPRASVLYQLSDVTNIYATVSTGFKSGTFSSGAAGPPVNPENIVSYEAGIKMQRGSTLLSLSAYHFNYRNIQISSCGGNGPFCLSVLQNAGTAAATGLEGEADFEVVRNLKLNLGASYVHARYKKFPRALALLPNPTGAGNLQTSIDAAGHKMVRQPDFSANVGATYKHEFARGSVELSGNISFTGGFFWDVANSLHEDPSAIANMRVAYIAPSNKFTVSLFANNIFDEKYNMMVLPSGFGSRAVAGRPRSFGAEVEVRF